MNEQKNTQSDQLVIKRNQLSRITALFLLGAFFIFLSGYFLGKRKAVESLCEQREQEAFADHLHHAVSILYPPQQLTIETYEAPDDRNTVPYRGKDSLKTTDEHQNMVQDQKTDKQIDEPIHWYKALLTGFGSRTAAQSYVNKLKKYGINTNIIKHASTIAASNLKNRRVINWYQVATDDFESKDRLGEHIKRIKRIAPIHDAQIVKVSHGRHA